MRPMRQFKATLNHSYRLRACLVLLIAALFSNISERLSTAFASPTSKRIEVELVTIRASGFEPGEINRPPGKFLLAVDNRSGISEVDLRLDRLTGGRVHEARVSRDRPDWQTPLELTPGQYLLTEAYHPNWICRITIGQAN